MTDLWTRCVSRLADAPGVPLRTSATAEFALDQLWSLADRAEDRVVAHRWISFSWWLAG